MFYCFIELLKCVCVCFISIMMILILTYQEKLVLRNSRSPQCWKIICVLKPLFLSSSSVPLGPSMKKNSGMRVVLGIFVVGVTLLNVCCWSSFRSEPYELCFSFCWNMNRLAFASIFKKKHFYSAVFPRDADSLLVGSLEMDNQQEFVCLSTSFPPRCLCSFI